jgi:hypothetical protein
MAFQRVQCYDVASVRQRDGAKRHDTLTSDTGHVHASGKRNAAVAGFKPAHIFDSRRCQVLDCSF